MPWSVYGIGFLVAIIALFLFIIGVPMWLVLVISFFLGAYASRGLKQKGEKDDVKNKEAYDEIRNGARKVARGVGRRLGL